jgi:hypothetical protein
MILPRSQRIKGREVGVGVLAGTGVPTNAPNINPDVAVAEIRNLGTPDARLQYTQHTHGPIEGPYREGNVKSLLVSKDQAEANEDVIPASNKGENSQQNMRDKKELVRLAPEIESADNKHE